MRASVIEGGRMFWGGAPAPALGPRQIRIQVAATAVNRADLLQKAGQYAPPPGASPILGLECAGTVSDVGLGVTRWKIGDRVCALLAGGGYAEQVVCPADHALPVPAGLTFAEAAALPEVLATAWLNLFQEGGVLPGERVLLHAGASGVGTAAIQLCRLKGSPCFVTAGSDEKIARCLALGAAGAWNRRGGGGFSADVLAWSGGRGADLILDPVGGSYLAENLRCLAQGGRLVLIGLMGGRSAELDLGRLLMKRQRIIGSILRSRSNDEKSRIIAGLEREVWPAVARGDVRAVIDRALPITAAEEAHALVASDATVGKVVLTVDPGA